MINSKNNALLAWILLRMLQDKKYDNILETYDVDLNSKCDIIDIANEEMEKIDSSEIDTEFKKVFIGQLTQNLIDLIANGNCTQKDIDSYLESLNDDDILDIRISGNFMYIKTVNTIIPLTLSVMMEIDEKCIETVPIIAPNNFFIIDCQKWATPEIREASYDPDDFVDILMDIGGDVIQEDIITTSKLFNLTKKALNENWKEMPENINIEVAIEDKVVAIAFDQLILNPKEIIGEALFLNPKIFIDVNTPMGTVLLIDTRRWYLEPNFGGEEWYH